MLDNLLAQGAQTINLQPGGSNIANAVQNITIGGLVGGLIRIILVIAALVFFFMLVIGGVQWILSGGDKAKTESARGQITAALVGLVIVFAAWAIVTLVNAFFGINLFNLTVSNI